MTTPDLPAFLTQRYDEQEAVAREAAGATAWRSDGPGGSSAHVSSRAGEKLFEFDLARMVASDPSTLALAEHVTQWLPGAVLADLAAKRRIVGLAAEQPETFAEALRYLAEPFADHPDFDARWAL